MEREHHDPLQYTTPTTDPLLITTKLTVPPQYLKRIVPRPHVYALLDAGLERPLILMTAPAGFGKTTLVSEWLRQQDCPAAWVSLEQTDNSPTRFWHYVMQALHRVYPDIDTHNYPPLASEQENIEAVLTALINTLTQMNTEVILVLDNYQTITAPSIHQVLTFLVEHLPPQLHLALLTRYDPPLPLARLRVQGKLVEIRTPNLRFTLAEAETFLTQAMGLHLLPAEVHTLAQQTEGWIAGLQLAALSIQNRLESATDNILTPTWETERSIIRQFVDTFTGTNKYIMHYLTDEVLNQQPLEIQQFLLETSILDQFNASLCDAVTGQHNGETLLGTLEQNNLFMNVLDNQQHWYRYDRLFAELLRYRLMQRTPEELLPLHQRASHWYEQHEMFVEAIHHALEADSREHAVDLIEHHAWSYIQQGQEQLVYSWLTQLPTLDVTTRPMLAFLHARMLFFQAQSEACEQALIQARQLWQPEMLGYIYDLYASIALAQGNGAQAIKQAEQALAQSQTYWLHSNTLITLGAGYLMEGDLEVALQFINDGARLSHTHHFTPVLQRANMYQGIIALTQGNLHAALQIFQQLQLEHSTNTLWCNVATCTYLAAIYQEWDDLPAALEQSQQALQLVEQAGYEGFATAQRFIVAARIARLQNDRAQAMNLLNQAEQSSQRFGTNPTLLAQITELRIHILLQNREAVAARQWYQQYKPEQQEQLEQLPHDAQEYWACAQARLLLDETRGKAAQALLIPLLQVAQQQGRSASALKLTILLTLAYYAEGNTQQTLLTLEQALLLAEPGGYMRIFVDEGAVMVALLTELYSRYQRKPLNESQSTTSLEKQRHLKKMTGYSSDLSLGYIYTLLHSFGAEIQPPLWLVSQESEEAQIDKLSEREYTVLGLIAEGHSNQEIAQKLVVTVSTIKTHLNNIYAKLHVHTRLQAVTRAYDLGLLRRSEVQSH